jgi:hypothetical protein
MRRLRVALPTAGRRAPLRGMRRFGVVLAAAAALAGCGDDERPAAPADPDAAVSSEPGASGPPAGPVGSPATCGRLGRRLVGTALSAASGRAERRGCPLRVAVLDGEPQALTEDYAPARINVRVRDGVVTRVEFMG